MDAANTLRPKPAAHNVCVKLALPPSARAARNATSVLTKKLTNHSKAPTGP